MPCLDVPARVVDGVLELDYDGPIPNVDDLHLKLENSGVWYGEVRLSDGRGGADIDPPNGRRPRFMDERATGVINRQLLQELVHTCENCIKGPKRCPSVLYGRVCSDWHNKPLSADPRLTDHDREAVRDFEGFLRVTGMAPGPLKAALEPQLFPGGTCDAGDCDEIAEWVVLTSDGWLPMCTQHKEEVAP